MMKKDKWLLVGGGIFLSVCIIGTALFMMSDVFGTNPVKEVTQEKMIDSSMNKSDKSGDKEKNVQAVRGTIATSYLKRVTPVGYGTKEFPLEQSGTLKESLLRYAESGEVDAILSEMEKYLASNRFSEDKNLEIAGVYADATFARGLVGKKTSEIKKVLPTGFKTPEMLAIVPLFLPEEMRRTLYKDSASLTPLNPGPWRIQDKWMIQSPEDAEKDEVYQENSVAVSMFNVLDGLNQIHVIELIREEEPNVKVRAYVGEYTNGKLVLYGYYVPDGISHYYQNVAYFEEIEELYLKPNDEYQQEQAQKGVENGEIPESVLEAFLNPTN